MTALVILVAGYPITTAALILVDRATGWQIAEAFGKDAPRAK